MKLRNKKTGKVIEWFNNTDGIFPDTLKKLNAEWEDYEEPKGYWCIDMYSTGIEHFNTEDDVDKFNESIGNYFESEEEAEKAVEKLKAWKRLKDKGFRIIGWTEQSKDEIKGQIMGCNFEDAGYYDLELLFGGEDE